MYSEIMFKYKEKLNIMDTNTENDMELISYKTCSNKDIAEIKKIRGLIMKNNNIIVYNYPYTDKLLIDEKGNPLNFKEKDICFDPLKQTYSISIEGTLLRVYCVENNWFLSTNNKISAFDSKWGNDLSFGELFYTALQNEENINKEYREKVDVSKKTSQFDKLCSILNPDFTYMFLLTSSHKHKIACSFSDIHKIFHVGTFHKDKQVEHSLSLPIPEKHKFTTYKELINFVLKLDYKKYQGIICLNQDNTQWKITTPYFNKIEELRSNQPNLDICLNYVQINQI